MGRLSCLSILLSLLRIWEQFLNLNLKHMISINSSSPFSFFPLFFPVCFFHLPIWVSAALSEEQGKSPQSCLHGDSVPLACPFFRFS